MKKILCAMVCVALFASCKKTDTTPGNTDNPSADEIAPDGFNFNTSKEVSITVSLKTNDDQPLSSVLVNVYSTTDTKNALFTRFTNASGTVSGTISIPAYVDSLIIDPAYIGLMRNALGIVKNNSINCVIGGSEGYGGDIVPNDEGMGDRAMLSSVVISNGTEGTNGITSYTYLSSYDFQGRPKTLTTPSDVISSELLTFINASLPEQRPVPTYHPDFLTNNAETNLNIEKTSDVWVTFVSEGAGYLNSLGFYSYPTATPPAKASDIDSIKIAIPNASLGGSGGAMRSGDKIYLGRFSPGTSIGFVLFQNAWNGSAVNTNATKFFADDALNSETNSAIKRHTVLLYDDKNKLFLEGFEDIARDNSGCDQDFNDLIFYAKSNPVDAISVDKVNLIDKPIDSDGDGVSDIYDKFPNDPTRAYVQYAPAAEKFGTLAYEDLWPSVGDYDLNDLVINYQYKIIKNNLNKVVEIDADYVIKGIGASKTNGFGVQMPFTPDKISSVTGQKILSSYIKLNANGTEANQKNAVIIPFDDPTALISHVFANTITGGGYLKSDTAHIKILFSTPLTDAEIGSSPFNPFIILSQQRGYEVHLPGQKPTDLADTKLFGTGDDKTSPAKNKYYLTASNWPWALSFVEDFDYPTEGNNISKAYNYFLKWAQSAGSTNADWYKDNSGNRNSNLIYKH